MKKAVSVIIIATIFLQTCIVYAKKLIPLAEATGGIRLKVKPTAVVGDNIKDGEIVFKNSTYYAISGGVETPLNPYQIYGGYPPDIKKSRWTTVIVVVSYFIVTFALFAIVVPTIDGHYLFIRSYKQIAGGEVYPTSGGTPACMCKQVWVLRAAFSRFFNSITCYSVVFTLP